MRQRLAFLVLAANGAVFGHAAGYAVTSGASVGHGYLPAVAAVLVPLGIVAAFVLAGGRGAGGGYELARRLLTAQVVVFLSWESAERLVASVGLPALLTESAVIAGLAAQLLGLALLVAALRLVAGVSLTGLVVPARSLLLPGRPVPAGTGVLVAPAARWSPRSLRGPPYLRFA